jgi:hypothetical protein
VGDFNSAVNAALDILTEYAISFVFENPETIQLILNRQSKI